MAILMMMTMMVNIVEHSLTLLEAPLFNATGVGRNGSCKTMEEVLRVEKTVLKGI